MPGISLWYMATSPKKDEQVTVKIDRGARERLDAEVARRRAERPGNHVTRGDVVREGIHRVLTEPAPKGRR